MPVLRFCPRHGREGTRERNGGVAMRVCGLMFRYGITLRSVARALTPIDVSHLTLAKNGGEWEFECE